MSETSGKNFRILVVDDDATILDLYQRILSPDNPPPTMPGFEVVCCTQGDEAVDAVKKSLEDQTPYAVVFLDLNMPPGPDGQWTADDIHRLDPAINIIMVFGALSVFQATLTLPGIAGIVLTVGMAVDANVLIFERIREEARLGRSAINAIDAGYSRALTTILDANITTFIAAIILFLIGSGPIRGFAVTLILGILMSMYTAIFCSRVIFDMAERTRRLAKLTMMQIVSTTQGGFECRW